MSNSSELLEACLRSLVLGIVQGLTEFLPISSTAHLKVVPVILGWGDPGISTTAVLQLGSIIAVISYFRKDLKNLLHGISLAFIRNQWREANARIGLAVCIGTIPILMAGFLIKIFWFEFEQSPIRSIPSIAVISIIMAVLLAVGESRGSRSKVLDKISPKDGFLIGVSQILALVPGVSRSGITLTTSLICGWKRQEAAKFSFLLGVPAISFAGLAELSNAFHKELQLDHGILPLLIGIISATIVSWVSIDWLLKYLQRHSTWIFVGYRLLFGFGLLIWWEGIQAN